MFRTISILVPTRGRVASLERLIGSLRATVADPSTVEILFRCDDDDPETIHFLRKEGFSPVVGSRLGGYASLPEFMNELYAVSTGDLLLMINDDCEFFTSSWLRPVLDLANRYPDGIFNIGVNTELNSYMHPFPLVSRRYVEMIGKICEEGLVCFDIYHLDIARAFGRAIDLPSVTIKHHWQSELDLSADPNRYDSFLSLEAADAGQPAGSIYDSIYIKWRKDYKAKHDQKVGIAAGRILKALRGERVSQASRAVPDAIAPRSLNEHAPAPLSWRAWLAQAIRIAAGKFGAADRDDDIRDLFDSDWYLSNNPDVADAGVDLLSHYLNIGAAEGRDPHPLFDSDWYLLMNPDVAAAGINPLVHYIRHGGFEGRDPHPLFDSDWYLAENPDVARAHINPLVHYQRQGRFERRSPNMLESADADIAAAGSTGSATGQGAAWSASFSSNSGSGRKAG